MILVDTSVWVDHLRQDNALFASQLYAGRVLMHPFVLGELALGALRQRQILADLADLPQAIMATNAEVLSFIENHALHGRGVGYVDVHLLAAARLTPQARLWTLDKRLSDVAGELGLAADP